MPLTDMQLRKLKPAEKQYTISDKDGLSILIMPNGAKWWRIRYSYGGKRVTVSGGVYPEVSLSDARAKAAEIRSMIADGVDPRNPYRLSVNNKTFKEVAEEWYDIKSKGWSKGHIHTQKLRLFNYIIPAIGHLKIADMTPADYMIPIRLAESKGKVETAHRYAWICSQISEFALVSGYTKFDVAAKLSKIMLPRKRKHYATITDKEEIGALLRAIDEYPDRSSVKYALRIMPYVFVRSGELREARWSEFKVDEKLWVIPPERMKMRKQHVVPLCKQVLAILDELKMLTGQYELLFPGFVDKSRCITDNALLLALRRLGYNKEKMTVHGFRAMASTILNEQGYRPDVIETQLAHKCGNAVREAYNRALYIDERRTMMQEWADYLDSLRAQQ